MQRAYIATSPNLNCFERKNEKNLNFSFFINHYEIQSNFVLTKKIGLSAVLNGGFRNQFGGEIAGIYYKNFNDSSYFEIQSGYGYFTNRSEISNMPWDPAGMIAYGQHFSRNINTIYHKVFIQPTYFYRLKKVKFGFAVKLGANYFDRYHYDYSIRDDSQGDSPYIKTFSSSDFRYKWGLSVEPAVKVQFNSKFFLQWSMLFTSNIASSPVYTGHYEYGSSNDVHETDKLTNPQHLYFIFTLGYELKFGKKKEK